MKLKSVFISLKLIICFTLVRPFGSIIHDISIKHEDVSITDLRRFEKLKIRINKIQLDITFLENCQLFQVTPKFVVGSARGVNKSDVGYVEKHILKAEIRRHCKRRSVLDNDLTKLIHVLRSKLSGFEFYLLNRATDKNVKQSERAYVNTHEKKLRNLTKNHYTPFKHEDIIDNKSSYVCTSEENEVLQFGLQHTIRPRFIDKTDVFTTFENIHRVMKNDLKEHATVAELKSQISFMAHAYTKKYKVNKKTLEKHKVLKRLQKNTNIVITKPDKGNGIVILNRADYLRMMYDIVNDNSKFAKLDGDKTILREKQLQRFLLSLKKKGFFTETDYAKVYPVGSAVARIYGLPKTHKIKTSADALKLRPIVSCIKSYNYDLSKFLANLLTPLIPKTYCAEDTFSFVKDIKEVSFSNKFMVSYDVMSLFTNIPLDETINIAVEILLKSKPDIKVSRSELKSLFVYATSKSHFLFDGQYYDQIDGVAMGSPLGPVLANLFMAYHEKSWIENYSSTPIFYKRYVDDIFCLLENEMEAKKFLDYLNKKHPSIKFTMETEVNKCIPFLDVLITSTNDGTITTSVYRKSTFMGLFLNFVSFTPMLYKLGLIKTLIDRVYKICHDTLTFNSEIAKVKEYLCKNSYPPQLVDKQIKAYLSKIGQTSESQESVNISYLKLPYIGTYSKFVQNKVKQLCKQLCKNTNIKLVFTSPKISSYFSTKDKMPSALRSSVVYKFTCACCKASYVGETTRHYDVRVGEHLYKKSQPSSIFEHLESDIKCRNACDFSCFKIIDKDVTSFRLKVKEAIHNEWIKPTINKQQKLLKMGILV